MIHSRCCVICGKSFDAKHPTAKYCGERCKKRAQRKPGAVAPIVALPASDRPADGALTAATRRELAEVDRDGASAGLRAILAAQRLDAASSDTGSSYAALLRAHEEAMTAALRGVEAARDPVDEIVSSAALKLIRGAG